MITTVRNYVVSLQVYKNLYKAVKTLTQRTSLQLFSGMILCLFVSMHFLVLSLGIFSLEVIDTVRWYMITPWRTVVGTILLTCSFIIFWTINLWDIYRRGTRRLRLMEIVHACFVLLIPFFLIDHIIETRILYHLTDAQASYAILLYRYWVQEPFIGIIHALMLVMVWWYVCLCVGQCLRKRALMAPLKSSMKLLAIVIPTLALCGFIAAGMQTRTLVSQNPAYIQNLQEQAHYTPEETEKLYAITLFVQQGLLGLLLVGLGVPALIPFIASRRQLPKVSYKDRVFDVQPQQTLLDAIRMAKIPHASICGGKGRCSTCRVRVSEGLTYLDPPTSNEWKVLQKIKAPSCVRLACQIHPQADLRVVPVLPPTISAKDGWMKTSNYLQGEERDIAVLFADIRGFTKMADTQLPYDIVFVLNQYFAEMGRAVESAGGYLDKFIGDGVMAWFGIDTGAEAASRCALRAARLMLEHLQKLNTTLRTSLQSPLRIGIGIHVGPVIVGEMGYGTAKNLTAIGDTVNIASRLEGLTKEYKVDVVISEEIAFKCGDYFRTFIRAQAPIRGKRESVIVLPLLYHELPVHL